MPESLSRRLCQPKVPLDNYHYFFIVISVNLLLPLARLPVSQISLVKNSNIKIVDAIQIFLIRSFRTCFLDFFVLIWHTGESCNQSLFGGFGFLLLYVFSTVTLNFSCIRLRNRLIRREIHVCDVSVIFILLSLFLFGWRASSMRNISAYLSLLRKVAFGFFSIFLHSSLVQARVDFYWSWWYIRP